MSTNITTFPVAPSRKVTNGKVMAQFAFATPLGEVVIGFYQTFEATPDHKCTAGSRRPLTLSEAVTYARTGVLPVGFESRPVVSGGFKKDEAKDWFKAAGAREALAGLNAPKASVPQQVVEQPKATEAAPVAVVKPTIDATAIIAAAIAAGKPQDELLQLIAALK